MARTGGTFSLQRTQPAEHLGLVACVVEGRLTGSISCSFITSSPELAFVLERGLCTMGISCDMAPRLAALLEIVTAQSTLVRPAETDSVATESFAFGIEEHCLVCAWNTAAVDVEQLPDDEQINVRFSAAQARALASGIWLASARRALVANDVETG